MDGRKRAERPLPGTYRITHTPAGPFGQVGYRVSFDTDEDGLLFRCARAARAGGVHEPPTVVLAGDGKSIVVCLDGPDHDLALLKFLTEVFKPEQRHGCVEYRLLDAYDPHVLITFVGPRDDDNLWAVASTLRGVSGILTAVVEAGVCKVEFISKDISSHEAWGLLLHPTVERLITFDPQQAPSL